MAQIEYRTDYRICKIVSEIKRNGARAINGSGTIIPHSMSDLEKCTISEDMHEAEVIKAGFGDDLKAAEAELNNYKSSAYLQLGPVPYYRVKMYYVAKFVIEIEAGEVCDEWQEDVYKIAMWNDDLFANNKQVIE